MFYLPYLGVIWLNNILTHDLTQFWLQGRLPVVGEVLVSLDDEDERILLAPDDDDMLDAPWAH